MNNPDLIKDVSDFHRKFGIPVRPTGERFSMKVLAFRMEFLMEELDEFNQAVSATPPNLAETLDALVDLVYVAIGTADMLNLPFAKAWAAVQEKNMLKVRASDPSASKRGSDLDVVKPKGWTPPDIYKLLPPEDQALMKPPMPVLPVVGQQIDLEQAIATKENKSE